MKHSDLVAALCKPGEAIVEDLSPEKAHLWHMASAICGEAGELFDAIKKHAIYGKEIDLENVVEELGDLEFYLEGLRQGTFIKREETILSNIVKLSERYKSLNYSDKAAVAREDKSA